MFHKDNPEVLVVGAGPVGLFASLLLAQRGIQTVTVDRKFHPATQSYAVAIHSRTLELLADAGIVNDLLPSGRIVRKVGIYDNKGLMGTIPLETVGGRFPFVLILPQNELESQLERRLKKLKQKVLWNHELAGLTIDRDDVSAEVHRYDQMSAGYPIARSDWVVTRRFNLKPRFVLGADGFFSSVRKSLGSEYESAGPPTHFSLYEFETDEAPPEEISVALTGGTTNVLWPIGPTTARWNFQIPKESDHLATTEHLMQLINERAPWSGLRPQRTSWSTSVTFEPHLASLFGRGRTWLAGDAAHLTGPVGAQSVNIGMREARTLADIMASAIRGTGTMTRLESYGTDQRNEWRMLLGIQGQIRPGDNAEKWVHDHASSLLPCIPSSGEHLEKLLKHLQLVLR